MSRWAGVRGFTLIEVMLVIIVLGLLATSLVPRYTSTSRAQLDGAARQFAAHLVYMRERAQSTGLSHTCESIVSPYHGYHIYQGTSIVTEIANPLTGQVPFTIYFRDNGYSTVTWQTQPFTIVFDSIGVPAVTGLAPASNQYLPTLTNGSTTQSVKVVNITGLVR